MVYNSRNFVLIYAMVVSFSSLTFAPWKKKPTAPAKGTMNTCYDWLIFDGFSNDNIKNKTLAYERERSYDHDVSYFAAGFAYLLTNESRLYDINKFGPLDFCGLHTLNFVSYPYITLKDAEFTCEGWIDFYLFIPDRDMEDQYANVKSGEGTSSRDRLKTKKKEQLKNFDWADYRERSSDNIISIWAAKYFQFLISKNAYTTPREFCNLMENPILDVQLPQKFPFMTLNGSLMSCKEWEEIKFLSIVEEHVLVEENSKNVKKLPFVTLDTSMPCYEWIKQGGFTDNKLENFQKIQTESVDVKSVNYISRQYIAYVKERHSLHTELKNKYEELFQKQLEDELQLADPPQNPIQLQNPGDIIDFFMTPHEYCELIGMPEIELVNYYGKFIRIARRVRRRSDN